MRPTFIALAFFVLAFGGASARPPGDVEPPIRDKGPAAPPAEIADPDPDAVPNPDADQPPPVGDNSCPAKPLTDDAQCGPLGCVVDFKESAGPDFNQSVRTRFKVAAGQENTLIRLGPEVDIDFAGLLDGFFPIAIGRCTTITSVASFDAPAASFRAPRGALQEPALAPARFNPAVRGDAPPIGDLDNLEAQAPAGGVPQARSAHSPGPALRFEGKKGSFLQIRCFQDGAQNDGVTISGFRIFGPNFNEHTTGEVGVDIVECVNILVANMEIAGFGGAAISVSDESLGRNFYPGQVRIVGNYIHNNQHPNAGGSIGVLAPWWDGLGAIGGHAGGYGVVVGDGAWAHIEGNVFDFNRHAIAASGKMGGYRARRNLVLKGGGHHADYLSVYDSYTHQFDVHGSENCLPIGSDAKCGDAGDQVWIEENAFQYVRGAAIHIRGRPRIGAYITDNVFAHSDLDDAISLETNDNVSKSGNRKGVDTFGEYGVCDMDGDGVDDLFLATGVSWWYSSYGEFPWTFLSAQRERLADLKLGYFNDDQSCDVMVDRGGWAYASGGYDAWTSLGDFGVPLRSAALGRFDPNIRDHRRRTHLKTTHAFRRESDGQWMVTPLSGPNWTPAASSGVAFDDLNFGDFTGDGVTDVLAVVSGRWQISEGAVAPWRKLNFNLGDDVSNLKVVNLDAEDDFDDVLKLSESRRLVSGGMRQACAWLASRNGAEKWRTYHSLETTYPVAYAPPPCRGFAGQFSAAPGGGVMLIGPDRIGRFYSAAESDVGAAPEFSSTMPY
jgi:hypothetical protein